MKKKKDKCDVYKYNTSKNWNYQYNHFYVFNKLNHNIIHVIVTFKILTIRKQLSFLNNIHFNLVDIGGYLTMCVVGLTADYKHCKHLQDENIFNVGKSFLGYKEKKQCLGNNFNNNKIFAFTQLMFDKISQLCKLHLEKLTLWVK